jgi:DsbC/DsbD-like thiol-disulfide interchange protein
MKWAASILLALLLSTPGEALAPGGNVEATLLSERTAVARGAPFYVGIRMKIRRGWHIYWKNPGDSGLPPRIAWTLPKGFVAGPIEWPIPERFAENDLMAYGYDRDVIFPVRITPPGTLEGDSITIAGKLEWLECADVCVPGSAELRLSLPVSSGPAPPSPDASALAAARARLPVAPEGWSFSAQAGPRAIALALVPPKGIAPRRAYLFIDKPLVTEHAAPQGFERMGNGYRLTLTPAANAAGNLARLSGVLVIEEAGRSGSTIGVNVDVPVVPGGPAPAPVTPRRPGWPILAYAALLGIAGLGLWFQLYRARRKHPNTNP